MERGTLEKSGLTKVDLTRRKRTQCDGTCRFPVARCLPPNVGSRNGGCVQERTNGFTAGRKEADVHDASKSAVPKSAVFVIHRCVVALRFDYAMSMVGFEEERNQVIDVRQTGASIAAGQNGFPTRPHWFPSYLRSASHQRAGGLLEGIRRAVAVRNPHRLCQNGGFGARLLQSSLGPSTRTFRIHAAGV